MTNNQVKKVIIRIEKYPLQLSETHCGSRLFRELGYKCLTQGQVNMVKFAILQKDIVRFNSTSVWRETILAFCVLKVKLDSGLDVSAILLTAKKSHRSKANL